MMGQLDAFQMRGLRKIMGWQSTYMNRANTNKKLRRAAGMLIGAQTIRGTQCVEPIQKVSTYVKTLQEKYMGHLLREPLGEPTRTCTFCRSGKPFLNRILRRGRPRAQWTLTILNRIWRKLQKDFIPELEPIHNLLFDPGDADVLSWLEYGATWREF